MTYSVCSAPSQVINDTLPEIHTVEKFDFLKSYYWRPCTHGQKQHVTLRKHNRDTALEWSVIDYLEGGGGFN